MPENLLRDGAPTRPRPEGMALFEGKLFVALPNLNQDFLSGGPGYVIAIDTETNPVVKVIETQGRNTVSVKAAQGKIWAVSSGALRFGARALRAGAILPPCRGGSSSPTTRP